MKLLTDSRHLCCSASILLRCRLQVDDKKKKDIKEQAILTRWHTLPEQKAILVHPSTTAKSGRFDCTVMSLSVLLDYRPEDNKEHSFEVGSIESSWWHKFETGLKLDKCHDCIIVASDYIRVAMILS